jgi:hypothetical protein
MTLIERNNLRAERTREAALVQYHMRYQPKRGWTTAGTPSTEIVGIDTVHWDGKSRAEILKELIYE